MTSWLPKNKKTQKKIHPGLSPQTQLEMSSALLKTGFDITKNGWKCQQVFFKKDLVLLPLHCQEMSPGVLNYTRV